jgi:hypothetical protein
MIQEWSSSVCTPSREERKQFLVLDNFEQLLPTAAAQVADLLAVCPGLTLLVTSRVPLQLRWERELRVPPLPVPDLAAPLPPLDEPEVIPSVALFVQRARARSPFRSSPTGWGTARVDTSRTHRDTHLTGPRVWIRKIHDLQDLRAAKGAETCCLHDSLRSRPEGCTYVTRCSNAGFRFGSCSCAVGTGS